MNLKPEDIWETNRLKKPIHIYTILFFLMWTPFGIILMIFRIPFYFLVWLPFYRLASKVGIRRVFSAVCWPIGGLWCKFQNKHLWHDFSTSRRVLVGNHISDFDPAILWRYIHPEKTHVISNKHWRKLYQVIAKLGFPAKILYTEGGRNKSQELIELKKGINNALDQGQSIIIFPEGCTSNGKAILEFNKFTFSFQNLEFHPYIIKQAEIWPIRNETLQGSLWANLLWSFFLPVNYYTVTFLEPMKQKQNESSLDFAQRTRKAIAEANSVPMVDMNFKHKRQFLRQMDK